MQKLTFLLAAGMVAGALQAQTGQENIIRISTDRTDLVLQVGDNGRLYQSYLGEKLDDEADVHKLTWQVRNGSDGGVGVMRGLEMYSGQGNEDFFEPALAVTHADGNASTFLYYVSSSSQPVPGGTQTDVLLRDDQYPLDVTLHYVAYPAENVIKTWSEITHREKKPIRLSAYASSMLYFHCPAYYLTEFSSDWAREGQMATQPLLPGKKILDTKLGSRAGMYMHPFFELGLNQPAHEQQGEVLMGTLGWTGNFRFTFEVDNMGTLRVISGINPYASCYELQPGEVFRTPEFIFTLSTDGVGEGSRNLQTWARRYQLMDGQGPRLTLLNNWENTAFDFNQSILTGLMGEAKHLGVDMFLLDDGWFGNKYPRRDDKAALGDWEVTHDKLPGGIRALTEAADSIGIKFGLWVEPEMISPKSELYEKHPDWAIHYPNREPFYYRNQLVLDLSNPAVQDYVFGVVDGILRANPDVAYLKWDCNSPITNAHSPYLKERQGQFYIDHVRGFYQVLQRLHQAHPHVPMMLCSGGGARCDYEALKYFTEFWCSDNTDPVERIYIQWAFSQFFPAKAMCAHVTSWNKQASVKFRTDVASMCKLGFDLGLKTLSTDERTFCREAVAHWKSLQPAIMEGCQYRLVSPYEGNHAAVNYVSADRTQAVLFAYDIHPRFREIVFPVRLQGLDPHRQYKVEEINLMPGTTSTLDAHGKLFSGDYLMKVGLNVFGTDALQSHVVKLTAQ